MKRSVFTLILTAFAGLIFAQTISEKNIDISPGQKVYMNFKYPELIRISTWTNNQISITAIVSINLGKNDDAFALEFKENTGDLEIISNIKDYDRLPRNIIVKIKDREYMFEGSDWNDPEFQKFQDEHKGENISWISSGVAMDIKLEIRVPKNIQLDVYARHGVIEILDMPNSITANSRHGGVDVSISSSGKYDFDIITKHGEVFTNLNLDIENDSGFRSYRSSRILAKLNGGGNKVLFESRHGNIYLRAKE